MLKALRLAAAFMLAAATTVSWAGKVTNKPPSVSLTAPTSGSSYTAPASIVLTATASDTDGTVSKVDFYYSTGTNGSTLIGSATQSPYTVTWNASSAGSYSLTAKATDNAGASTTSTAVSITVSALTVPIKSPAAGSVVQGSSVSVSGTFTGDDTTSVWVDNGNSTHLATLNGNSFSTMMPVYYGPNTINVTVVRSDRTVDIGKVTFTGTDYPKIAFTSPTTGTFTAPANITLAADAVSPGGSISQVTFSNGNTVLATVKQPPYQYAWNSVPSGSYTVTAQAIDDQGNTSSVSTAIKVNSLTTPPTVSLTSPTNNATFSTPADITLTASASSSDGKTPTVEFYHDGVLLSSTNVSPFTYTWKGVAAGKYSLTARAIDSLGAAATSTAVNVTVSDPASNPVQFTSPKSGTTYVSPAAITLSTSAPSNTVGVTYYRTDTGTNIQIGSSNTSPYSYTWNMRTPGTYTVISQAVVNVSGSLYTLTSDPITVTVTANPTGETITYLHNDFLGSAIAATDANGAVIWQEDYNPYGERLINNTDASGNRQFYTGKPLDTETGLTYFGARYYDPAVGRFMTIDPVGFKEDIYSFNRYGYGNNNPYKFVDPDGRDAQLLIGGPYAGHSYGHVALRVYGKGYDVTYDFGRYGATWGTFGSEGEGMLRVWSNFNSYIAGENATGRTTTAYTYKTTPEADKATMAFYENQIGKSSAIETRAGMKQFRIQDYHAANNNCTTESIAGLGAGNPGLASRLNNPKFDTGGSLGAMERLAYRTAKKGSGISMPSDLNDSIRSAGGYSNSTTYPK